MTEDQIDELLVNAGVSDRVLTNETAVGFVGSLGLGRAASSQLLGAFEDLAEWDGPVAPDGELEFRVGRWHLDLKKEAIRTGALAAILAAVIAATGGAIGVGAIAMAVVPSLFNIERIQLTRGQQALLIEVRRTPTLTTDFLTAEDIYRRLPPEVQAQVNPFDFADFVALLKQLGLAEPERVTGTVRIREDDEHSPIISWA